MNKPEALKILEKVLGYADAEAVVATMGGGSQASTRFADNAITQNVRQNNISLRVSCASGESHGSAVTNDLSDESLRSLVQRAQAIAKVSPPDPEYMPPVEVAESKKYPKVEAYFEQTLGYDPLAKATDIAAAVKPVKAKNFRLSGAYSSGYGFGAFANSAGLRGYHRSTDGEIHATVLTPTGSGWAEKAANNVADIDVQDVVGRALKIAESSQDPADSEAGKYAAILSPPALAEMLMFMFWGGFDAKATDEGRTFLRGKLGAKVCGENVSLRSDPSDKRCPGSPFQHDGLTSPTLHWMRDGVVENLSYSRFWAKKQGKKPTGMPSNIIMEGGDTSVQDMIASTEKGVLITRFWYIRFVDPMVPLVTGMTRDGLFLIEDGRVTKPIKHLRFNVKLLELLSGVEALGEPVRTGEYISMLVPTVKVRDFNFTSTTKF
jgi:predicted Zn-dependent protease